MCVCVCVSLSVWSRGRGLPNVWNVRLTSLGGFFFGCNNFRRWMAARELEGSTTRASQERKTWRRTVPCAQLLDVGSLPHSFDDDRRANGEAVEGRPWVLLFVALRSKRREEGGRRVLFFVMSEACRVW